MFKKLLTLLLVCSVLLVQGQNALRGLVFNEYLEPFLKAKISCSVSTTFSNVDGEFTLSLEEYELPQTIEIKADGFQTEVVTVTSLDKRVKVILKEKITLEEIVISASRTPERIIESPVTIERLGATAIRRKTSSSFYDELNTLKGITSFDGGYGYKIINTRGFATFSNSRFVQLVDGVDSSVPALNFSQGNLAGVPELDIQGVEILLGASSALYGANAYNGLMLLRTKNPFDYTGLSAMVKSGFTEQKAAGTNSFGDIGVRFAHKFDDIFAAKVNFQIFSAEEWHATDYRNKDIDSNEVIPGDFANNVDYNGVNTYGDDILYGFRRPLQNGSSGFLYRRRGYTEQELLVDDYKSNNLKFTGSLHFRPFSNEKLEVVFGANLSQGDNVLQGSIGREVQRDYYYQQIKAEVKGENFFVRAYNVKNNAGKSYDLSKLGTDLNNSKTSDPLFYQRYLKLVFQEDFSNEKYNELLYNNSVDVNSPEFKKILSDYQQKRATNPDPLSPDSFGAAIFDQSSYEHIDGNYNFKKLVNNWADIQLGGSYRNYNPYSKGTIFNDGLTRIRDVDEYGVYGQIQKKFADDRLKFTAAFRYDKSKNFEGSVSPRAAVNYTLGDKKNHSLRLSYQTGFRNPTMQEQYTVLYDGRVAYIATTKHNLELVGQQLQYLQASWKADDILNNSFLAMPYYYNKGLVVKNNYSTINPESVRTLELGYRSLIPLTDSSNLDIDFNTFLSNHNDFIFYQKLLIPSKGKIYPYGNKVWTDSELLESRHDGVLHDKNNVIVLDADANTSINKSNSSTGHFTQELVVTANSRSEVYSYGAALGLRTKVLDGFDLGVNYSFIDYKIQEDKDFGLLDPQFNTPNHTIKVQFGKEKLFNNFGFNTNFRWIDSYHWSSPFARGDVDSRTVVDAQVNYKIPALRSVLKLGGTNLLGKEYSVAPGTGNIGRMVYLSWIVNNH